MKYLNEDEINSLCNKELVEYNKWLQVRKKALLDEATAWQLQYTATRITLKQRLEDTEMELLYAEEDRENSDVAAHDALTRLH